MSAFPPPLQRNWWVWLVVWLVGVAHAPSSMAGEDVRHGVREVRDVVRDVEGWTLHIHPELLAKDAKVTRHAVGLLEKQLREIVRVVPAAAVAELRKVPLYFSPPYPGTTQKAEYHPGAQWLRDHGRDPAMVKGVEFTNTAIFEQEMTRMPNVAFHELSHAYHDLVIEGGFRNAELLALYEAAKAGGSYERVARRNGRGRPDSTDRAYGMTTVAEYFAESSEAYFVGNDFYPFVRSELKRHDPGMHDALARLWAR